MRQSYLLIVLTALTLMGGQAAQSQTKKHQAKAPTTASKYTKPDYLSQRDWASAGAMVVQGKKYREAKDYEKAFECWRRAAELKKVDAFYIGMAYTYGYGVAVDAEKAIHWYKKAIEAGDRTSLNNIGVVYRFDKKDSVEAFKWYKKAAEANVVIGMINLAAAYEAGRGCEENKAEALVWYKIAADALANRDKRVSDDNKSYEKAREGIVRLGGTVEEEEAPGDILIDTGRPVDAQSDSTRLDTTKVEDTKANDAAMDDTKPGEAKATPAKGPQ